jgi:hypothetical protein
VLDLDCDAGAVLYLWILISSRCSSSSFVYVFTDSEGEESLLADVDLCERASTLSRSTGQCAAVISVECSRFLSSDDTH